MSTLYETKCVKVIEKTAFSRSICKQLLFLPRLRLTICVPTAIFQLIALNLFAGGYKNRINLAYGIAPNRHLHSNQSSGVLLTAEHFYSILVSINVRQSL